MFTVDPVRLIVAFCMFMACAGPEGVVASETDGSNRLEVTIQLKEGVAYLKHDIHATLRISNPSPRLKTMPASALGAAQLVVSDDAGNPIAREVVVAGNEEGLVEVQGYGTTSIDIDLTSIYPKLTARKRQYSVSWSYGDMQAGPLHFQVIEAYNPKKDRMAVLETDFGRIRWELLPEAAPEHVRTFVNLARQGFYDGLTFFRYVPGLQLEGGDPKGDGTGGWKRLLPAEISSDLQMQRGLVGALRRQTSMTSDSMFFITLGPSHFMKGVHTFYARVIDGWEAIARVHRVPNKGRTGNRDEFLLLEPVTIQSIKIK